MVVLTISDPPVATGGMMESLETAGLLVLAPLMAWLVWRLVATARSLRQEKERRIAEQAERSAFLARIAEEVRQPLVQMMGESETLAREERLGRSGAARIGSMRVLGERMMGLVDLMLDLSWIETVRFDLEEVMEDLRRIHGMAFAEKGLFLSIEAWPEAVRAYRGDKARLMQLLFALASEALNEARASEGGLVVEFSWTRPQLSILFRGAGVRFMSLQPGLSLSLAGALARAMGGRLSATPPAVTPAVWTLSLPMKAESRPIEARTMFGVEAEG
jgi:signal transduction histidine kinase